MELDEDSFGMNRGDYLHKSLDFIHHVVTGGCAAKLGSQHLYDVVSRIDARRDSRVISGLREYDDAAVLDLSHESATIFTVDFMPALLSYPAVFGRIAAANALSDVYAMGGEPLMCLNIVGISENALHNGDMSRLLCGGQFAVRESGAILVGGHTIRSEVPIYGLAVIGSAKTEKCWFKNGALPGDAILLTKPLGTGVIMSALKQGLIEFEALQDVLDIVAELNKQARDTLTKYEVHAASDVTGFGLAGTLYDVLKHSRARGSISLRSIPCFEIAKELVSKGVTTSLTASNSRAFISKLYYADSVTHEPQFRLLFDPQSNGGIIAFLPEGAAKDAQRDLEAVGLEASIVGFVESLDSDDLSPRIRVG